MVTSEASVRLKLDHGSHAWSHAARKTPLNKLQTVQNTALRVITVCTKISAEEYSQ